MKGNNAIKEWSARPAAMWRDRRRVGAASSDVARPAKGRRGQQRCGATGEESSRPGVMWSDRRHTGAANIETARPSAQRRG